MAFDISTLVTDRKQSDVVYVKQLIAKIVAGTATEPELAEWKSLTLKGAYNYTDLNRVSAAMEYLRSRLNGYGYATPGYQRIEVPHRTVVVSKLPEGFTELAYIESSGTQYIDTNYLFTTQNHRVVLDFAWTQSAKSSLYGCKSTTYGIVPYKTDLAMYVGSSNALLPLSTVAAVGVKHTLDVTANNGTLKRTFNGVTETASYSGVLCTEYAYTLFACTYTGTIKEFSYMKMYSCQIYDNGVLIRDFVPCKNPDGAYGLYDVANSKFYGNAGSGAFTGGAVVDPPVPSVPSDDETREPFLWYEDDIPTANQMAQYITNVAVIRDTMEVLSTTPAVPGDMEGLTAEEANAIEFILIDVQTLINNMVAAWFYSGDLYAGEV